MKHKKIFIFSLALLMCSQVFAQDTATKKSMLNDQTYLTNNAIPESNTINNYHPSEHQIYRDTRLGSSSRNYNTYEKNAYGAGAITTNPHKSGGISFFPEAQPDSNTFHEPKIYRDTRLGSSSAPYNTYQKNDDGAGAVTTNPRK